MVNISQILKYTPASIKKRKINTVKSIRTIRAILDSDEYGIHQKAFFNVVATSVPRKVNIKLYGPLDKPLLQKKIWVHCSCEWFTYFCEYALAKKKSSTIINSNGKPPVIKNPRQWPYVCKHIIRVFEKLPKVKFKKPKSVKPTQEDINFFLKELDKYIDLG